MTAVGRVTRSAAARRRVQSLVVAAVALLSTGTVVLAIGLLVASNGPFDHAFARQSGAHATATFDADLAPVQALTATAARPGVTAAAGPFDAVSVAITAGGVRLPTTTIAGRAAAGGPVDRLTLDTGQWLTGPGQIVLSRQAAGPVGTGVGDPVVVGAGGRSLRVVGIAESITGTAGAWVWPSQADVLSANGAPRLRQMLYRFASAGDDAAVRAGLATVTAGLRSQALIGSSSYLADKRSADSSTAPIVPFVIAFGVLGLVMSVLIVANVVSGAVVAGYRTIGVLKTLGFTPGQVVAVYSGQVLLPGMLGCIGGAVLGNLLALPLLSQTQRAYDVSSAAVVPGWVDLVALLGLPAVIAVAAVAPALRAGRFSATQAISVGRAPRAGRGYRVRRVIAAAHLPVPLRLGLGAPFARPARTAVTVLAVLLGAVTVVFAVGLSTSLHRVASGLSRTAAVPVEVSQDVPLGGFAANQRRPGVKVLPDGKQGLPDGGRGPAGGPAGRPGSPAAQAAETATVGRLIGSQPGTARLAGFSSHDMTFVGLNQPVLVNVYDADSSWVGYPLISGRWYAGPGEAVAGSGLLRATGHRVGDTVTLGTEAGSRRVRVTGEILDTANRGETLIVGAASVAGLTGFSTPDRFEVGLTAGTDPNAYVATLSDRLPATEVAYVRQDKANSRTFAILYGLVATLAVLLSGVAALGVVNTVVLNTRERVHEIGVLKTVGMTPGQVRAMVVASMAGVGLLAGVLATPLGYVLHHRILPVMANAAGTALPGSMISVYRPVELVGLGASGILLAILGALLPAGWAAATRTATALRAE